MQVFDLVSKLFPGLCHICTNSCGCQTFGRTTLITSSKAKKRKAAETSPTLAKMSNKTATKGEKAAKLSIEDVFSTYADADDTEAMDMEGISNFCEALNIDASTDVKGLVLMWRMGAGSKPGCITKEEFIKGFATIGAKSMDDLEKKCPSFDPGFLETKEFREFYKFVFQFNREGTNKTIERDIIVALLPLVLDLDKAPHLTDFLAFLDTIPTNTRITLDQWESFLLFNKNINADLSNYEEDGACKFSVALLVFILLLVCIALLF